MPLQDITALPTPPARSNPPETFITRADAFIASLPGFVTQVNTLATQLEATAALINVAPAYADPGLYALVGLTAAADKVPYWTGSGTSATMTVTSAARSLLDDADAPAMLTTLGVSAFVQTILNDADAAAVRTTIGAFASGEALPTSTSLTETGTIGAGTIGFRGVPASTQSVGSGITLALEDAGRLVQNTTGGWTIPANASVAFPIGTAILLYNSSASAQNLAITTDTLRLSGTTATGTRSILPRGLATVVKVSSTVWVVSGSVT